MSGQQHNTSPTKGVKIISYLDAICFCAGLQDLPLQIHVACTLFKGKVHVCCVKFLIAIFCKIYGLTFQNVVNEFILQYSRTNSLAHIVRVCGGGIFQWVAWNGRKPISVRNSYELLIMIVQVSIGPYTPGRMLEVSDYAETSQLKLNSMQIRYRVFKFFF